jgi:hypothetical protein
MAGFATLFEQMLALTWVAAICRKGSASNECYQGDYEQ